MAAKRKKRASRAKKKKVVRKRKTVKRVGTSVTKKSTATGKAPGKRLKKRRKANTVKGCYPNPSPSKVSKAVKLFEKFSGQMPRYVKKVNVPVSDVLLQIGACDGVIYTAMRDGKKEKYIHEFTGRSRPTLASSHDGKQLYFVGGAYNFTEDGIVDKR